MSPETEIRLAAEAKRRGISVDTLLRLFVEQHTVPSSQDWDAKIVEFQDRVAALPVLDPRGPDELIGYDEHGMW